MHPYPASHKSTCPLLYSTVRWTLLQRVYGRFARQRSPPLSLLALLCRSCTWAFLSSFFISFTVFSEEILFSLTSFFLSSFSFFPSPPPPPKHGPCTHQTSVFPLSYMPCLNLLFIISRTMIPLFSIDFLI